MSQKDNRAGRLDSVRRMLRTMPLKNHFKVHMCMDLTVGRRWGFKPRVIDDLHLVFVVGGSGYYTIGDREVRLCRGRVIFVSHSVQYSTAQEKTDPPHIIPVRFAAYSNETNEQVALPERPVWLTHIPEETDRYQGMFELLHHQHKIGRGPFRMGLCASILHQIMSELVLECMEEGAHDAGRDARIEKVRGFMAANPLDRSSIEELAGMGGLSKKYFTGLFKKQVGLTPKNYQISLRLNRARELLEHTGATVKQVAYELGYPDPYMFSKQFKKMFGYPPVRSREMGGGE